MPDRTRIDPSLWCPLCAAGNCPERCEEGCHHVCDIEALWRLAAAALHDRLYGYPVGDHRAGLQWDEAQALAGLVLHAIPDGWSKADGEWRPLRTLRSRLLFVLRPRRCADVLSTRARAMRRKGSYLPAPEGDLEQDDSSKTLIHLDTSVRPGGIDCLFLEDLGDDELDGLACVECGRRGDPMVPIAQGPRGQVFACEYGCCGRGPGYTEPPLDWDPDKSACMCGGVGSACTCCRNCGAPMSAADWASATAAPRSSTPTPPGARAGTAPRPGVPMTDSPEKRLAGERASSGRVCRPRCAGDEAASVCSRRQGNPSDTMAPWRIQDAEACLAGEEVLEPAGGDIPVEGEVWRQVNGGFTL